MISGSKGYDINHKASVALLSLNLSEELLNN
jgi:hypothetical protein